MTNLTAASVLNADKATVLPARPGSHFISFAIDPATRKLHGQLVTGRVLSVPVTEQIVARFLHVSLEARGPVMGYLMHAVDGSNADGSNAD